MEVAEVANTRRQNPLEDGTFDATDELIITERSGLEEMLEETVIRLATISISRS